MTSHALLVAVIVLTVGARAYAGVGTTRVADVRVAVEGKSTRVVFELDGPAAYAIAQEQHPGLKGPVTELVVHLNARGAFQILDAVVATRVPRTGLVESVRIGDEGAGGVARIRLRASHPLIRDHVLGDPPRIVIELSPGPLRLADLQREAASEGQGPLEPPRRIREAPQERERRKKLTERPEEKRPERPLAVPVLGRPLVISGEYEIRTDYDRDRRLGRRDDDRATLAQQLELELFYEIDRHWSLFAETKVQHRWDFYREGGGGARRWTVERGETWLNGRDLAGTGLGFQVGRLNARDEREWWWDENLDGVRLFYEGDRLQAQVLLGQELGPEATDQAFVDPEQDDVLRLLASAGWQYARHHRLDLFFLGQRDGSRAERVGAVVDEEREDEVDADLTWVGLRASGHWDLGGPGDLHYWGNLGGVRGRERVLDFDGMGDGVSVAVAAAERRVQGWAADAGLIWETVLPGRPALTLAYAFGSGDPDPDDDRITAYRPTGLSDNEARLGGTTRVRYYGELFDPELSNLHVATAAVAFPLLRSSSLTLLYHYYHQAYASRQLRDVGLRALPGGRRGSLGHGLDAVLGFEEWERVRFEAVGSVFRAGSAYEESRGELAYGGGLKLELGF